MSEIVVRLDPPASLTPELRLWISQRFAGEALLTRSRVSEGGDRALLLRINTHRNGAGPAGVDVDDLLTDLRLLGLRPTLVSDSLGELEPR